MKLPNSFPYLSIDNCRSFRIVFFPISLSLLLYYCWSENSKHGNQQYPFGVYASLQESKLLFFCSHQMFFPILFFSLGNAFPQRILYFFSSLFFFSLLSLPTEREGTWNGETMDSHRDQIKERGSTIIKMSGAHTHWLGFQKRLRFNGDYSFFRKARVLQKEIDPTQQYRLPDLSRRINRRSQSTSTLHPSSANIL